VLEQGSTDLLVATGLGDRLLAEGVVHHGVNLQFDGERHRIDFAALTGRHITLYGQQEVLKDLIAARLAAEGPLVFEAQATAVAQLDEPHPVVTFRHRGRDCELRCEIVAGCDGFHGVCRSAIPEGVLAAFERMYPFAWLGILAAVIASTEELVYAFHERGFALHSLRTPEISRLYLQVDPDDNIANWPDERIWTELALRLASPGWTLREGPILEKAITPMRSYVCEPMQYQNLFLAGDAAHIVPPTGAKGMNLAIADVTVLAPALADWFQRGERAGLDTYSSRCLDRVWRVQDFSNTMTELMHVLPNHDPFAARVQRAKQRYMAVSAAMQRSLAENYVGLPLV
jgi:p-hydroxybenzoate 3-monooxygenase